MNAVLDDIMTLIAAGTSWVGGTGMFAGREPVEPNNSLTLFDTPGGGRLLQYDKDDNDPEANAYDYAHFQVRIRSHDYNQAMTQSWEIVNLLHGTGNKVVDGTLYTVIEALDNPALLEWDDNNRAKIVTNFAIQRTPETVNT